MKSGEPRQRLRLMDEELRVVWGEVYAPDYPGTQGHVISRPEIRKMAHHYLSKGNTRRLNLMHTCECPLDGICECGKGSSVVESFVAREDDLLFVPGSWVIGVHVPDDQIWTAIKNGDLNGFSMEALVLQDEVEIDIEIPDDGIVRGLTGMSNPGQNHDHGYTVRFGKSGKFLGGRTTSTSDGPPHDHDIAEFSTTEKAMEHNHRWSIVDALEGRV